MSQKEEGPKPHELLNLYIYYLDDKKEEMMNWKYVLEQIHIIL